MKRLSPKIHTSLDYGISLLMLITPSVMDFSEDSVLCRLLVVPALLLMLVSMLTDQEISLAKFFGYNSHLKIDFLIGTSLLLGSIATGETWHIIPHCIFGCAIVLQSISSKKQIKIAETPSTQNNIV